MFAIKRRLKLNQSEKTGMKKHAGFSRFVYNYALDLFWQSVNAGLKASDSKRLSAIKKCLTQVTKKADEYLWMNELSSTVYQSAFQHLQTAFGRWRQNQGKCPAFKKKKDCRSFTVYNCNGLSCSTFNLQ
ncbi:MAG: helix-turn-helix domain-containing protein [Rhizonema sp. PD37]|nr:helix-turn-helix domain-containing protein [Rhizonema sp. PD37]